MVAVTVLPNRPAEMSAEAGGTSCEPVSASSTQYVTRVKRALRVGSCSVTSVTSCDVEAPCVVLKVTGEGHTTLLPTLASASADIAVTASGTVPVNAGLCDATAMGVCVCENLGPCTHNAAASMERGGTYNTKCFQVDACDLSGAHGASDAWPCIDARVTVAIQGSLCHVPRALAQCSI